ncbi:hypothetical protein BLSTO_00767 [Blastocystis sp. subtype 1]
MVPRLRGALQVVYLSKQAKEQQAKQTVYVSSDMDSLEQAIDQLTQKKQALEKKSMEEKPSSDIVVMNGEKYVLKGKTMEKYIDKKRSAPSDGAICLDFCKYGSCNNPNCPNKHDRNLVRLCPAFLRGSCSNESCKLNHMMNVDLLPLCVFFLKGNCTNESCHYRHERVPDSTPVCRNFNAGYCKDVGKESEKPVSVSVDVRSYLPSFMKFGEATVGWSVCCTW